MAAPDREVIEASFAAAEVEAGKRCRSRLTTSGNGDRPWWGRHEVSIPVATSEVVGRCCGWQPASNVSMTIMRPPQQGHGVGSAFDAAAGGGGSSLISSGTH